jgi:hypothetical protein
MGPCPALPHSRRWNSGRRTSTGSLTSLREALIVKIVVRSPCHGAGLLALSPSYPHRAVLNSQAPENENAGLLGVALTARCTSGNAMRVFHHLQRRWPTEDCVSQEHNPAYSAAGVPSSATPIDPLGSALVSVWVYQKPQRNARMVQGAEREARRTSFSEHAFTDNARWSSD